jgi:hypothetical protein
MFFISGIMLLQGVALCKTRWRTHKSLASLPAKEGLYFGRLANGHKVGW